MVWACAAKKDNDWVKNYYYNCFADPGLCLGLPALADTRYVKPGR